MERPRSPQKSPYKVKVEKGKIYSWCTCGLSNKQPFCDGAHKTGGGARPTALVGDRPS